MTDDRLDELLADARTTYRVPLVPPVAAMWKEIDASLTDWAELEPAPGPAPAVRTHQRWRVPALAAATLLIGVALGRFSVGTPESPAMTAAVPAVELTPVVWTPEPLNRATSVLLGDTEALLRDLQVLANRAPSAEVAAQATTLLVTTRLLLDSPAATDVRMQNLLEDLELVLAQIAALNGQGTGVRRQEEMQLIRDALTERDVVPRLRTAVVTLASYQD